MKLSTDKAIERRKIVIERLTTQLLEGKKPNKFGTTKEKKETPLIPLTDKDRDRINKEIQTLKTRV